MNITLDSLLESKGGRRLKIDRDSVGRRRDRNGADEIEIINDSEATLKFRKNSITIDVYIIPKDVEDLTTDVEIKTETFLTSIGSTDLHRRKKRQVVDTMTPVLNPASAYKSTRIKLAKNCGNDDVCQADIRVKASTSYADENQQFLIVDSPEAQKVSVKIDLKNRGPDPAWNSELIAEIPIGARLGKSDDPIAQLCSVRDINSTEVSSLVCPTGIHFRKGSETSFTLNFEVRQVKGDVEKLLMKFRMGSRSELVDRQGNRASVELPVRVVGEVDAKPPVSTPQYAFGW